MIERDSGWWKDHKGRHVQIHTLSDQWLKRIKKYLTSNISSSPKLPLIKAEIKRRDYLRRLSK